MNTNQTAAAALKDQWTRFDAEPSSPAAFSALDHLSGESAGDKKQVAPRASFTPGPWLITGDAGHPANVRIASTARRHIAKVYAESASRDLVCEANARLIEAAPRLYAELKHASELLTLAAFHHRTVDFEGDRFDLLAEAERFDALIEGVRG